MAASGDKIAVLDSIRGMAAFVVVLCHYTYAFFPAATMGSLAVAHTSVEQWLFKSPLSILFAGRFAVILFFVLSGFVLTLRFVSNQQGSLFPAAIKRYVRLMPIALVSVLFAYLIMSLGFIYAGEAAQVTGSGWLTGLYVFDPSLSGALLHGLLGVFSAGVDAPTSYNPVLWTIYYEFLGSLLVFGIASLVRGQSKRWLLYIIALLAFINTFFCGFILGLILADLYASRQQLFERIQNMSWVYKSGLLLFALLIAAFPTEQAQLGPYWNALILLKSDIDISRTILELVAASIIIMLALSWGGMTRLLERRQLIWLGKISYALYATHFIILFSLASGLFTVVDNYLSYLPAVAVTAVISISATLALSALWHRYIELPSIVAATKVGEWSKK